MMMLRVLEAAASTYPARATVLRHLDAHCSDPQVRL